MGAISARASGIKTIPTSASLPATGFEGQKYIAEDTGIEYTWHSGSWNVTGGATAVTGPASATDNAVARFDSTTGKIIQNSVVTIDDNGATVNNGTDGTIQTADKADANNSVAVNVESGTVTGVAATGTSGAVAVKSGATVDGNSGDVSLEAGTPTGTGTQGNANLTGKNITLTLEGEDDILTVKSGATTIATLEDDQALDSLLMWLFGTAANPSVNVILQGNGAAANALLHFFQDSTEFGQIGYFDAGNVIILDSREDKLLEIVTGVNVSSGTASGQMDIHTGDADAAASGDLNISSGDTTTSGNSGDVNISTGAAAGTRGDVNLDGKNVVAKLGDAAGADKVSITDSGDVEVSSIDSDGNIEGNTLKITVDTSDVSNPPTDAELDAIYGTPATVGAGFTSYIDDNGGGANFYQVVSDGTNWWVFTGTKAV